MPERPDENVPETHGEGRTLDDLMPVLYADLRRVAQARLAALGKDRSISPTELVHEAWWRLLGSTPEKFSDSREFVAVAARKMRDILVDRARRKATERRGGGWRRIDFDAIAHSITTPPSEMLAIESVISEMDARKRQLVELRFFAGLTMQEVAGIMGESQRTLEREWIYIRARLRQELGRGSG